MATGRMITARLLRRWGKGSRCGRDLHNLSVVGWRNFSAS
jgi:hypothetical protein